MNVQALKLMSEWLRYDAEYPYRYSFPAEKDTLVWIWENAKYADEKAVVDAYINSNIVEVNPKFEEHRIAWLKVIKEKSYVKALEFLKTEINWQRLINWFWTGWLAMRKITRKRKKKRSPVRCTDSRYLIFLK